jgi:hypothetical protein
MRQLKMKYPIGLTMQKVSPKDAAEILAKSIDCQRNLKQNQVRKLAIQMDRGAFSSTADPIKISADGTLINGQHRLHAVIQHGKPVDMLVMEGQPLADFHVIDTDIAPRHAEDHAVIEGRANPHQLVPLMRWQWNFEQTKCPTKVPKDERRKTEYELQAWGYENHEDGLDTAMRMVKGISRKRKFLPHKVAAWCLYQMMKTGVEPIEAEQYIAYLLTGNGSRTLTTHQVREKIIDKYDLLAAAKAGSGRILAEAIIPLIAKGWWCNRNGYINRSRQLHIKSDEKVGFTFD